MRFIGLLSFFLIISSSNLYSQDSSKTIDIKMHDGLSFMFGYGGHGCGPIPDSSLMESGDFYISYRFKKQYLFHQPVIHLGISQYGGWYEGFEFMAPHKWEACNFYYGLVEAERFFLFKKHLSYSFGIGYGYYHITFQEKKTWTNTPDYQKIYDRSGLLGLFSLSLSFQIKWFNIEYRILYTQKPKTIYDKWGPMKLIHVGLEFRDVF